MQGLRLFFVAALLTIVCAQGNGKVEGKGNDKGGCCFYSSVDYDQSTVIACTDQPFRKQDQENKEGIRSFHCTGSWAAEINGEKGRMEEATCGDEVGETTEPMDYHNVTIAECLERRCCLYTGKNKDGNEFCLFSDDATPEDLKEVQKDSKFAVAECPAGWQATLRSKGKSTTVGCGVTLDLTTPVDYEAISLKKCPPAARAEYVDEEVVDTFQDQQFDAAVVDTFDQSADLFQAEQVDAAFIDNSMESFQGESFDAAVTDTQEATDADGFVFDSFDAAAADSSVDSFDAAVMDEVAFVDSNEAFIESNEYFDQAAMDTFEQTFEDQQVLDNNEYYGDYATDVQHSSYSSGSAIMGSLLALVAVFVVIF